MNSSPFQIYNASAGSGKTFTLVKEYLKILIASSNIYKYKEVLAITFTNKAVGEMKARVIEKLSLFASDEILNIEDDTFNLIVEELNIEPKALHLKSKKILESIIHNYAAFDISTIDRFTHKIIRTFAHDLKLPVNFEVELDTESLINKAVDNLIAKTGTNKDLTKVLVDFAIEKTDDDKSWDISYDLNKIAKLLVNETHIPHLKKLKDKTLKDFKDLKKNVAEKSILLEQQIIEAAKNVLTLIEECGLQFEDFSRSSLPKHFENLSNNRFDIKFDNNWQLSIGETALYPKKIKPEIASIINDIQPQLITAFRETKQGVFQYKLLKNIYKSITPLSVLNAINNELNIIKDEENLLLISEFNAIISNEINNQPVPFIYERIGEKFKHYFIDEFQDTSELQWQNLIPLLENSLSGQNLKEEKGTTMLVGDAKQAIYRWRGGKAEQFINLFNKTSKPFTIEQNVENLPVNFRSSKEIIIFNNAFFKHLSTFTFNNSDYAEIFQKSNQELYNKNEGFVNLEFLDYTGDDDKDEVYTQKVLETITTVIENGYELKDICILVRKKKEGVAIANVLSQNNINIISSETLLLNRSSEVIFMLNMMRLAIQPNNNEVKVDLLNYIADDQKIENKHTFFSTYLNLNPQELFNTLDSFDFNFDTFLQLSIYDAAESLVRGFNLNNKANAYIQFFLDEVLNYSQKNHSSFSGFIKYWESKKEKLSIVSPEGQDAVQIMTIHKSKGLEFPVVIFPYAELDIYRELESKTWFNIDATEFSGFSATYINLNKDLEQINEVGAEIYNNHRAELELDNINLLYVALTRPVEQLYIIGKKDITSKGVENQKTYSGLIINYLKSINKWDDAQLQYNFGASNKTTQKEVIKTNTINQERFISTSANSHNINIITKSGFLWDTTQKEAQEKGNLVHDIMAKINTEIDIDFVLQDFLNSGLIGANQHKELEKTIKQIVNHPQLKNYYSQDHTIYNEKDIITKDGEILRPDRIVINSKNQVAIIDYKTGLHNPKYQHQLQDYQDVLEEMSFKTIKKILIYINDTIKIIEY